MHLQVYFLLSSVPQYMKQKSSLLQILGLWDSIAISVGIAIGVGIFRVPSEIAKIMPFPKLIILAWIAGGLFSTVGALCYAELSSSLPETGGDYIYIREAYGLFAGFLYGWSSVLVIRTGIIAALSFVFAEYLCSLFSLKSSFIKPIAIATILFLSAINGIGLSIAKSILNLSVIAKILSLLSIIIFAFILRKGSFENFHVDCSCSRIELLYIFGLSLVPVLWTYGGWHESTFMTGEIKDAQRTIPVALVSAVLCITFIYLFINIVYIYLVPVKEMIHADLIAADAMKRLLGKEAKKAVEALIVLSSFGTLNATIMTSSRITYAMSKDSSFFRYLAHIDERFRTPIRAIMLNAIWSIGFVIWGTFSKLIFFTGLLVWIFFAAAVGGIFILRKKMPDLERPFKVWGYPFTPALFVIVCLWICLDIFLRYPKQSFFGLLLAASGIPVYLLGRKR